MIAIWALVAFIVVIIAWNLLLKRNIGESMGVGFVVCALFAGTAAPAVAGAALLNAVQSEIIFAALAFTFMSVVLQRTGVIERLVDILNSIFGRLPGGAGYVATIGSAAMGMVSGSTTANAATVGSITIPWMKRSNFPPALAATVVAGNSGMAVSFPPNTSMFVLIGAASVAPFVSADALLVALFVGGLWSLAFRLLVMLFFTFRYRIAPVDRSEIPRFSTALASGWTSMLVGFGIALPLLTLVGPPSEWLTAGVGSEVVGRISIVVWIPVLVSILALLIGRRRGPRTRSAWVETLEMVRPSLATVAPTLIFAFAASDVLSALGLGEQLSELLALIDAPLIVMALVVGVVVVLVAGPLTSTATLAAIGGPAFAALYAAGAEPLAAAVAILIFASTEGASPPSAAPLYLASGMAQSNPVRSFVPLIVAYVIPSIIIGALVAAAVLPVIGG